MIKETAAKSISWYNYSETHLYCVHVCMCVFLQCTMKLRWVCNVKVMKKVEADFIWRQVLLQTSKTMDSRKIFYLRHCEDKAKDGAKRNLYCWTRGDLASFYWSSLDENPDACPENLWKFWKLKCIIVQFDAVSALTTWSIFGKFWGIFTLECLDIVVLLVTGAADGWETKDTGHMYVLLSPVHTTDLHGNTLTSRFLNLLFVRFALTKCDESAVFVVIDNFWRNYIRSQVKQKIQNIVSRFLHLLILSTQRPL